MSTALPEWIPARTLREKYDFSTMKIGETRTINETEENFRRIVNFAYTLPGMQFETHWRKTYGEVTRIVKRGISRRKNRLMY